MRDTARNCFTFLVDPKETKKTIARLISSIYGVNVINVQTIMKKGKTRRVGKKMKPIQLSNGKKAIVELKQGQTIDAFQIGEQPEVKK